jgi:hypothetical protein
VKKGNPSFDKGEKNKEKRTLENQIIQAAEF